MKHRETKDRIKISRESMNSGTISSNLTFMNLEFQKERRSGEEGDKKKPLKK